MTEQAGERGLAGPTEVHRFALVVSDIESSLAWYRDRFDFEVEARWDAEGEGMRFALLRAGDVRFELMERDGPSPEGEGPFDMLEWIGEPDGHEGAEPGSEPRSGRFVSGELTAVATELEAMGMRVVPSPRGGSRRRVHILRDPDGRRVELVEPERER